MKLPVIGCCCPACGDLSLQRQRIKQLLMDLEREHVGVKQSMLKALSNVSPRHLLDTRLNPAVEILEDGPPSRSTADPFRLNLPTEVSRRWLLAAVARLDD